MSEKKTKPCGALKCPGHIKHELRAKAKENGAPEGTCALWADSTQKGFCEVSAAKQNPCVYSKCHAHKDSPVAKKKRIG